MEPSKNHHNRKPYNWLLYDQADKYLIEYIPFYKGLMLDFGCADKPYEEFFKQHVDSYLGVDWDNTLHNSKADIIADLNKKIELDDAYADTIVSLNVLEHLYEPQLFLNEVFRILKPDGALILHIPFQWWIDEAPHDYFRYTPYGLRYLLNKAGFTDINIQPTAGFFTTILLKINYFSLRAIKGSVMKQKIMRTLLMPMWWVNQKIAPKLDSVHRGWSKEAQSFFVVAQKKETKLKQSDKIVIASLTTYGSRVNSVHLAINTILEQTKKADKVILWLAEDEFNLDNIPQSLKEFHENNLIEIKFCKDIKSYKKLIPTLELYPDEIIITFDDDILYKQDVIEILYSSYLKEPLAIHAIRGHKINFTNLNKIASYNKWDKQFYQKDSSYFLLPTGAGGILYPPYCFYKDIDKNDVFMNIAPTADDLWFKTMSLLKGVKCKVLSNQTGYANELKTIDGTQSDTLWNTNKIENDFVVNKLFEKYDLYKIFNENMIKKERFQSFENIINYSEKNLLVNNPLLEEIANEYTSKRIEEEISKYNEDKEFFWDISLFLEQNNADEFAQKSLNRYFAYKCVEFVKLMKISSAEKVKDEFYKINKLLDKSRVKQVFLHYISTNMLLNNIELSSSSIKCEDNLFPYLEKIKWEYKSFLYENTIEKIVKTNDTYTKSSVIIISNGNEEYILEALEEIAHQNEAKEYKIIFISNNHKNQTTKILNFVDTFIQMRENNGAYLARNIGSMFALSDILIFMEDDGIPEKGFVKAHECVHGNSEIIAVRGCYLTHTNGNMPGHYWLGSKEKVALTGIEGNCSFKAQKFYKIGGWGDYIMFGHGGPEICHRMLQSFSKLEQHIYSPKPVLYHDYVKPGKDMKMKLLTQHASWQMLKFSYDDFHDIFKKWK